MSVELKDCKNCEQPFDKAYDFCPHCGQKDKDDLTIGLLFYNTISNYFSFDARFFKSFFPLVFKPGYLAKQFIGGKRLLYLHPAQLYLFISVVFFFLLTSTVIREQVRSVDDELKKTLNKPIISDSAKAIMTIDSAEVQELLKPLKDNKALTGMEKNELKVLDSLVSDGVNKSNNQLAFDFDEQKVDSLIAIDAVDKEVLEAMGMDESDGFVVKKFYKQMLKFYRQRNGGQVLQAIYDTIPISLFILLPIFAFILKILYFKRGSYAHHLVFSFYFFSFLFTVFSTILILNYFWDVPDWIDVLLILSTFFYLFMALKRFYEQGWFRSFFKACLATMIYFSFVIPIAIILIAMVGFMFY